MLRNVSFSSAVGRRRIARSDERLRRDGDDGDGSESAAAGGGSTWCGDVCIVLLVAALDIAVITVVGNVTFKLLSGYILEPAVNGFHCHELASIGHAYRPNTVSMYHVLFVTLFIPAVIIDVFEAILLLHSPHVRHRLKKFFMNTVHVILRYIIGFTVKVLLMEAGKCGVGRLRPNFVGMCAPDWAAAGVDCTLRANAGRYVAEPHCTMPDNWVRTARGSMPSGHSSCAAYLLVFAIIHTGHMVGLLGGRLYVARARTALVALLAVWAAATCVSRITDRWHHPTDVLAGIALGAGTAAAFFGTDRYKRSLRAHLD